MNKNIKICFMGSPRYAEIVLRRLIDEYNVVLVVTQPDSFTKGGRVKIEQRAKIVANEFNIPVFQPEKIKENYDEMLKYDFDFLVTAAYGQFIPKAVLSMPKIETLNVHGSLLPKYRGGAPIQRAIMAGDEYLGVTIMKTVMKMDAGDIFKESKVKLEDSDTLSSMMEKLATVGANDLVEIIDKLYSDFDSVERIKQNEDDVTFSYNIKKEEEFIDFNMDARDVFNKIRALNDDPYAKMIFNNETYKIYESEVVLDDSQFLAGTILDNNKRLVIKCSKNAISILKIQAPSKNAMNIKDFLNGSRNKFMTGLIIK